MTAKMSPNEFVAKLDWEGGIFAALEYGLKASHLEDKDSDLAVAWDALEKKWEALQPDLTAVDVALTDLGYGE
jgi:gamma-glutamyl:cysteine ligase YbdK (ATP-grasp superfamily)